MAKKPSKVKSADQSSTKSTKSTISSVSQRVTSAVKRKAKAFIRPSKKVKSTPSTRSGSSTAILGSLDLEDDAVNETTVHSISSDDSSVVEVEEVDPEKELGEG